MPRFNLSKRAISLLNHHLGTSLSRSHSAGKAEDNDEDFLGQSTTVAGGKLRTIIAACVGYETSVTADQMQLLLDALESHQQKPIIYFEERDPAAKDKWLAENTATIQRAKCAESFNEVRKDPEWVKLYEMLTYLLTENADSRSKKEVKLSTLLKPAELSAFLNPESKSTKKVTPEIIKKKQDDLRAELKGYLEKDALNYIKKDRFLMFENDEDRVRETKKHFIEVTVDQLFMMSLLGDNQNQTKNVLLHLHSQPRFIARALSTWAARLGRDANSLVHIEAKFEPLELSHEQEAVPAPVSAPPAKVSPPVERRETNSTASMLRGLMPDGRVDCKGLLVKVAVRKFTDGVARHGDEVQARREALSFLIRGSALIYPGRLSAPEADDVGLTPKPIKAS